MTPNKTENWNVIGSSLTGTAHQKKDLPCQDAHYWRVHDSGVLVVAVADGAGSAPLSQIGASIAVHQVVEHLAVLLDASAPLDQPTLTAAFEHVRDKISAEAANLSVEPRQLACTLCVVLISDSYCIQANIGDSGAILKMCSGEVLSLIAPFKGEYANETAFVTDRNWVENLVIVKHDEQVSSAMVATDGLMDWSLRGTTVTSSFVLPILDFAAMDGLPDERQQQLNAFLVSPTITNRVGDDVTLVLCHRRRPVETQVLPELVTAAMET
jgi:hypothetical protein